jgi:hypothetical protein
LATATGRIFVSTGANAIAERVIDSTTVATSETTGSTSYANLATNGPAVTVTTGALALVFMTAFQSNNTQNAISWFSCAVSGATTIAASDAWGAALQLYGTNAQFRYTSTHLFETLTPGSNTFTMQYKVVTASTGQWKDRELAVIAL